MRRVPVKMRFSPMSIVVDDKLNTLKVSELILLRETILTRCNAWKECHKEADKVRIASGDGYNDVVVENITENQKRELYGYLMSESTAFDDVAMCLEQED